MIPENIMLSVTKLADYPNEVGGGFQIDNKNRVVGFNTFLSSKNKSIVFEEEYDIEFHVHPFKDGNKVDMIYSRMPSGPDVASVFTTRKEELVFTKGYKFKIGIRDYDLFLRKLRFIQDVTKTGTNEGRRGKYELCRVYSVYFSKILKKICAAYKKERNAVVRARKISSAWKKELFNYGIEVVRFNSNRGVINVY